MSQPADKVDPRIASVEAQINACMRGATNIITCPYCHTQLTEKDGALCCADMGLTVRAVLRKQAQGECLDLGKRIMDKIGIN